MVRQNGNAARLVRQSLKGQENKRKFKTQWSNSLQDYPRGEIDDLIQIVWDNCQMQGDVSRCLCMTSEHYPSTAELKQAKKVSKYNIGNLRYKQSKLSQNTSTCTKVSPLLPWNSKVKNGLIPEGMKDDLADTYLTHTDTFKKKTEQPELPHWTTHSLE